MKQTQAVERVWVPGDLVDTTAIVPATEREIQQGATRAKIRKIDGGNAQVIYGFYDDRATVPLDTCTYQGHDELTSLDLDEFPPYF